MCFNASKAQIYYPDGTTISSTISFKDINNTTYDLFTLCNSGKHVIIDLSATWCGPCWSYHTSKVLDSYYDKYGPSGTGVKDAQVFLYEVDAATTMADLQGTTAATQGDWIAGTTHPICNEASTNSMVLKFVQPGQSYGVPAVFVVCKDKKLYKISTNLTSESGLRSFVSSKCGVAPTSNDDVMDIDFSYNLYPNPAQDKAVLHLNLDNSNDVSYTVCNSLGQQMIANSFKSLSVGNHDMNLNSSSWAEGIYFVNLTVGNRNVNMRLSIAH